jgi:alpha-D-ribose 1-methylphosphonate 5-triphosphate synthase subunit PhnG
MIEIYREEEKCKVKIVSSQVPFHFIFTHNAEHAAYAALLESSLQKQLWDFMERARRDAYNLGWKDAKQKHRKREDFNCNPSNVKTDDIAW